MMTELGTEWSRKHEVKIINASFLPLKTTPRELSSAAIQSLRSFIRACNKLYGKPWSFDDGDGDRIVLDLLSETSHERDEAMPENKNSNDGESSQQNGPKDASEAPNLLPCDEVFRIIIYDLASPQSLVR